MAVVRTLAEENLHALPRYDYRLDYSIMVDDRLGSEVKWSRVPFRMGV